MKMNSMAVKKQNQQKFLICDFCFFSWLKNICIMNNYIQIRKVCRDLNAQAEVLLLRPAGDTGSLCVEYDWNWI